MGDSTGGNVLKKNRQGLYFENEKMNIKHHEIEIPTDTPFVNCKLNREPYAKVFTEIVSSYADGFVFAINNEWGTGKTTFAKMWKQQLNNEGFQTI